MDSQKSTTSKFDRTRLGYILIPASVMENVPEEALALIQGMNFLPLRVEVVTLADNSKAYMYLGASERFKPLEQAEIQDPDFKVPSYEIKIGEAGEVSL